jgi:hypothetical protein
MSGRRVLLVERHNAPGGLNSFYFLGGRKMDVGLHALTNYLPPGHKGALTKICRQLRIDREAFDLCPQKGSRIAFPGVDLRFGNGLGLLWRAKSPVSSRPRSIASANWCAGWMSTRPWTLRVHPG